MLIGGLVAGGCRAGSVGVGGGGAGVWVDRVWGGWLSRVRGSVEVKFPQRAAQVVLALGFFCRYRADGANGSPALELAGKAALDREFELLKDRVDGGEAQLSLQDLEPLHVFRWMLSDDQRSAADAWTARMLTVHTTATRIVGTRSVAEPSDAKAKRAKKREAEEDMSALFG